MIGLVPNSTKNDIFMELVVLEVMIGYVGRLGGAACEIVTL